MRDWTQDPPNAVQVEASEGCTIACRFCGIRGIREKANSLFNFMTMTTAAIVAGKLRAAGWNPRIEFAMHGEPTANPDLLNIVRLFRSELPKAQIMLTTNGMPLVDGRYGVSFDVMCDKLFGAGVNIIALDDYRGMTAAEQARKYNRSWASVGEYPGDPNFNPHQRVSPTTRMISIIYDIEKASEGNHAHLGNHAGAAGPKDFSRMGKRCAKPFRELSIRWDGNVAICCNDWRGEYKVGNVVEEDLEAIWHHPAMYAARRKLYRGERDFGPCHGCNHDSYRVGLLPDRMGKLDPDPADEEDLSLIDLALAGEPYTAPVLRVWERSEGRPQPGNVDGKVRMVGPDGTAVR